MKGIADALALLMDATSTWLKCIATPVTTLNSVLPKASDERHLSEATKVWVPSFLVSLVISFSVVNPYGIRWDNLGFHLTNWLVTVLSLVMIAFLIHRMLMFFGLKSEFIRTFVMYTTPVVAYSPIMSLAAIPVTLRLFDVVKTAREQNQSFDAVISGYMAAMMNPEGASLFVVVVSFIASLVGSITLVVFAEAVTQWYGNERFKTYSVIAIALALSAVISVAVVVMQLWTAYSFVEVN